MWSKLHIGEKCMHSVELLINLFGKPAWEIADFVDKELDIEFAEELKKLGDELRERLYKIAKLHEILVKNSWTATGSLYDIIYWKDISLDEAKEELRRLGLDEYAEYLEEVPQRDDFEEEQGTDD